MALVLTLREGDEIIINKDIVIRAVQFKGRQLRVAIEASRDKQIDMKKRKWSDDPRENDR